MTKQFQSTCYYVQDPMHEYAHFTVTPEIGLLQVHSSFGTFAHQWSAAGPDFKAFLIQTQSAPAKFGIQARSEGWITNKNGDQRLQNSINRLMTHLWPLFIEQFETEIAEMGVAV